MAPSLEKDFLLRNELGRIFKIKNYISLIRVFKEFYVNDINFRIYRNKKTIF